MSITDTLRRGLVNWLIPGYDERAALLAVYAQRREYREGFQRRPLKVKPEQADDPGIVREAAARTRVAVEALLARGLSERKGIFR